MKKEARGFKEFEDCVVLYTDNYLNDIEGEKLEEECNEFFRKGRKRVIIDFGNTELINSIGISILVAIMEKVREEKGVIFFSGLKKVNYDIFNTLGLTKDIPIFKTEEEALEKMMVDNF
ncbi:MAG: STAS domain-containing protein [Thermodesulfobacteriota bacterium]